MEGEPPDVAEITAVELRFGRDARDVGLRQQCHQFARIALSEKATARGGNLSNRPLNLVIDWRSFHELGF
jgi:hypothetical protein